MSKEKNCKPKFDFGDEVVFYRSRIHGFAIGEIEGISFNKHSKNFLYGIKYKGDEVAYFIEKDISLYDKENSASKIYDEIESVISNIKKLNEKLIKVIGKDE